MKYFYSGLIGLFVTSRLFSQVVPMAEAATGNIKREIPAKTIQSSASSGFLSYNNFTRLHATNDGVTAEGNINYLTPHAWNIGLNVSTPVTSTSQRVNPLTITGLSKNSSLTVGIQKIKWGIGFTYDPASYNNAIRAIGKDPANFNYDDLTVQERKEFDRRAKINWGTAFYFGVKAGIERQSFEYVSNPVTIAAAEDTKTAFKLTGTAGTLSSWGILALTFVHTSGYAADDPVKYYVPINNSGVQIERLLSPTAPFQQKSDQLRFEYLSVGNSISSLRINPNINIELNQQLFSFEFPVYFLTSDQEKTRFTGGVYAGYISDRDFKFNTNKNNIGFGIFIGAGFTDLFQ